MAYSYKRITSSLKTLDTVIRTGIKNYSAKATKNSPRILITGLFLIQSFKQTF